MKLSIINTIRTNNFKDEYILQKITSMWKEATIYINETQIKYGVYYEYESNYKGDYSVSVAIEDNRGPSISITNKEKYQMFKVDQEDKNGLIKTWSRIWEEEELGTLKRAYSYDYEKYYPNGDIEIYIAIK